MEPGEDEPNMFAVQRDIFLAFLRVGLFGYGGGPSSIPLVYREAVEKYGWLDAGEFGDILAMGNALPGPIATKMAGYIGHRVGGIPGLVNALLALTLPTIAAMILFLAFFKTLPAHSRVKGMTAAVMPVVAAMLLSLTGEFMQKSGRDLNWLKSLLLFAITLGLVAFCGVHPALVIALLILYALVWPRKKEEGA